MAWAIASKCPMGVLPGLARGAAVAYAQKPIRNSVRHGV